MIVPVGTQIYNSQKEFDPNVLYPGTTWERIKGVVLGAIDEEDSENEVYGFKQEAGTVIGRKETASVALIGAMNDDVTS